MENTGVLYLLFDLPCMRTVDVQVCVRCIKAYVSQFVNNASKQLIVLTPVASHPNYQKYAHLLSPGWIPGRMVDNSDDQYSTIRDNLPYMFVLVVIHPLLRRLYDTIYPLRDTSHTTAASKERTSVSTFSHEVSEARMERRVTFDLYFALVFLCVLHGFSALKVLLILYTNFSIAKRIPRRYVTTATWVFNIGILFANELGKGYSYATIVASTFPWSTAHTAGVDGKIGTNWGSTLDAYGGLIPRWEILFKITVLRLVSFNLDYTWSLDRGGSSPVEVCYKHDYGSGITFSR